MPFKPPQNITSTASFLKLIYTNNPGLWYRGEHCNFTDTRLTPSIFRGNGYNEKRLFLEFQALNNQGNQDLDTIQWLYLMQHYNLPTRLLDWTKNPLIALYFSTFDHKCDGFIYAISPENLNKNASKIGQLLLKEHNFVKIRLKNILNSINNVLEFKKYIKEIDAAEEKQLSRHVETSINHPIALFSEITNKRMAIQSSCFTLHGGTSFSNSTNISTLTDVDVYKIGKKYKQKIRQELNILSIHQGSIFPEIEYIASHLKEKHRNPSPSMSSTAWEPF